MIASIPAAGSLLLSGCKDSLPPSYGSLFDLSNSLTFASHRLLLRNQPLVREFTRDKITKNFPAINETNPKSDRYRHLLAGGFTEWRLPIEGLVSKPTELSLETLKRFPSRTQVTQHNCEQGWSAIAEWTGVPLRTVLEASGVNASARFVQFYCYDIVADGIDMLDALHPQTILAYGMNGRDLPVAHGAPLRARVETQLGYKSMKYLRKIVVTDEFDDLGPYGPLRNGWAWYAGI
jgi:DMSO/TMAO reductase YedYZ molybdopterin-dependent catalytic subunit